MPVEKKPLAEPIRGYRLIGPLGAGGFGEVWKCEAPGGIFKAMKFVYGDLGGLHVDSARAEEELKAVQLIKSIRHPFLLSIDRVENVHGELIIVTELADQNLQDLLARYQASGLAGVPRAELLSYLREAAEVLDLMNHKFDLQHLDVKPCNLFLVANHIKVADFGLVNSLASGKGVQLGAITPLYAAPELFLGKLSRHSDQYSLAIAFQEALTGTLPFTGENSRQLLVQHTQQEPNLEALPAADRPIIARALAKNPDHRFPSCTDLVRALLNETSAGAEAITPPLRLPAAPGAAAAETASPKTSDTQTVKAAPAARPLPPHVLPDVTFVESLTTSPLLDNWKVQMASGKERMVQLLYGFSGPGGKTGQEAANKLQSFQHPALVQTEIVHCEPGRLVLVTDLVKESLRDRLQQCTNQKQPGVPRGELVDYLRAAAEVLDYLYHQHDLQHLGLNPRALILDNGWLEIAEFGWAHVLWRPAGQDIVGRNSRYAAPELLGGQVSRACDQYSLAVIFAEMLTGAHPFRGQGRQRQQPDLAKLSETDRAVIARALDPEPSKRWPSCIDMVLALEGTAPEEASELQARPDHFALMLQGTKQKFTPPAVEATAGDLNRLIRSLLGEEDADGAEVVPPTFTNGGLALVHEFHAGIPLGTAKQKLELFSQQWFASYVQDNERRCLLQIQLPLQRWWQRFFHHPALQIAVQLDRVNPLSATPIKVSMDVEVVHCPKTRGKQLMEEMAPGLVESLRQLLLVNAEKRTQERLLWPHPVKVIPLYSDGRQDEPIQCRGKDISPSGLGFYLPYDLTTPEILVELPNTVCPPSLTIPATLVRAKRCADGWYEVGALFHLTALRKSRSFAEISA